MPDNLKITSDLDTRRLDDLIANFPDEVEDVVVVTATNVQKNAMDLIVLQKIILTGATLNSVQVRPGNNRHERVVGPTTEYAPFLEFGTHKMPARPFIVPAAHAEQSNFTQDLTDLFDKTR